MERRRIGQGSVPGQSVPPSPNRRGAEGARGKAGASRRRGADDPPLRGSAGHGMRDPSGLCRWPDPGRRDQMAATGETDIRGHRQRTEHTLTKTSSCLTKQGHLKGAGAKCRRGAPAGSASLRPRRIEGAAPGIPVATKAPGGISDPAIRFFPEDREPILPACAPARERLP